MTAFNEDSRVKIPALMHLTRLGYEYLPLKAAQWDRRNNICSEIVQLAFLGINPSLVWAMHGGYSKKSTSNCRKMISASHSIVTNDIEWTQLVNLPAGKVQAFCSAVTLMFERIETGLKERRELTQLRGWLLPLLMNCQVKVT